MPAEITVDAVRKGLRWECRVTVAEPGSATHHVVTVDQADRARFGRANCSVEQLVRESFIFLLQRESKESILSSFALPVIARYFPEYEREIKEHFPG